MKLKICGMRDPENIKQVAALNPDYMGFIFYPASKRFVGEEFEMPSIAPEIKKVGVFVNAKADYIIDKINKYKLDLIQLHGEEKPDFCEVMNHLIPVIKAFGVDTDFDLRTLEKYKSCCDFFLFDSKTKEYGGSGKQFERSLLKEYDGKLPFFISGGIGVAEVFRISDLQSQFSNLFGLDINSRFEISPGMKNVEELAKIGKLKIFYL